MKRFILPFATASLLFAAANLSSAPAVAQIYPAPVYGGTCLNFYTFGCPDWAGAYGGYYGYGDGPYADYGYGPGGYYGWPGVGIGLGWGGGWRGGWHHGRIVHRGFSHVARGVAGRAAIGAFHGGTVAHFGGSHAGGGLHAVGGFHAGGAIGHGGSFHH